MGIGRRVQVRSDDGLARVSDLMCFSAESNFRRGKRKLGVNEEWFECLREGDWREEEVSGRIYCS